MKNILLICILLMTYTFAEVSASATPREDIVKEERTHSISKRRKRTIKRVKPPYKYYLLNQDNYYYTNVVSNCNRYLEIIEKKDKEIEVLKKEINRLSSIEQVEFRKKLKEEHDLEIKKFDERKSGIRTQNSVSISNEPVK